MLSRAERRQRRAYDAVVDSESSTTGILYKQGAGGSYDVAAGSVDRGSPEGIEIVVAPAGAFDYKEIDGTQVLTTDRKVQVPAWNLDSPPAKEDRLEYEGTTWEVIRVMERQSGEGVTVAYMLHLRGQ